MSDHVAIVGGGLAGLTAAALLARSGRPVTVFEKASHLGGRAATRVEDGYHLNLGAHAFYAGGAAARLLGELNVDVPYGSPKGVLVRQRGHLHRAPVDLASMFGTDLLDGGDKLELVRLFARLPFLKPSAVASVDAQSWIERNARRPAVREFLAAFSRTGVYSTALDLVSAEVLLTRLKASSSPVRYVHGGWQTIVDGLRRAAESAGARVETGTRVERIDTDHRRVTGVVLTDGRVVPSAGVIVATTPRQAAELLHPTSLSPLGEGQGEGATELPALVACLDVALSHLPRPDHPVVQDLDGPHFLTVQSLAARIAPPHGAVLHAMKQLDPRTPSSPADDERELEAFLDDLQPGWRDHVVDRAFLPQMTASGILPTAADGGFAGRPNAAVPGLAGAYLAGDWVGPDGFQADAAMASAERAARAILAVDALARRAA